MTRVTKLSLGCKLMMILLLFTHFAFSSGNAFSQQSITVQFEQQSLSEVLRVLKQKTNYEFLYNDEEIKGITGITRSFTNASVQEVVRVCLAGTKYSFKIVDNLIVITPDDEKKEEVKKITVKGKVVDEKGEMLPGVTVLLKGTTVGIVTDIDGKFKIELPKRDTMILVFTFVGMKSHELNVGKVKDLSKEISIRMEPDTENLDEVVVTGYGNIRKESFTGSSVTVKRDQLLKASATNVIQALQSFDPSFRIQRSNQWGSDPNMVPEMYIRGRSGIGVKALEQDVLSKSALENNPNLPTFIMDGFEVSVQKVYDMDPNRVETINILKDAAATAMYGSRAANGVIIVTTKKGKKEQDATFSVNVSQSWGQLPRLPGVTIGRLEREMRLLATQRSFVAYLDPETKMYRYPVSLKEVYDTRKGSIDGYWIPAPGTDTNNGLWRQDSLNPFYNNATNFFPMYYETAKIMNANIQAYGGSERMMYGLGLGYYDEGGILKGTGYKRVDLNANLNVIPVKRFNVDLRFNASLVNRKRGTNAGGMLSSAPSVETVPGDPFELSTLMPGAGSVAWNAALENLRGTKESNRNIRLRTNFKLSYQIVDGLDLSTSLSADYSIARRNYFQPSYLDNDGYSLSVGETGINLMVLNENLLSYKKQFGEEHKLSFMAGLSYQYDQMEYNGGYAKNSPSNKIYYAPSGLPSYGTQESHGTTRVIVFKSYQSDMQEKALVSYFGRLEYSFRDKYLFTMAYRRDGSSTFGANHRWGSFPSVAVGWSFSEESFIKDRLGWLSFGKIRASWGRSGMHFDYPYLALGIVENGPNYEGNGTLTPNFLDGMYNEDLSWENTDQYDIGLDLDFFNYRLGVVLDYYYRYTDDMLMQVPLSSPNMYSLQWRNAAAISNEGVEILVKGDILSKPDLYWRVSVNWAKNWNRFRKSYSGFDENGWIIGKPLNGIYVMKTNGFVNEQNELPIEYNNSQGWRSYTHGGDPTLYFKPGDLKFVDVNGDGVCDYKDLVYAGSALPFCNGGIVNELRWKNWDMAFSVVYQLGRHVINTLPFNNFRSGANPFVMDIGGTKFWEKPGDDAEYPSWENALLDHFNAKCDRYVEKVNWLKMKTLTVGYTMPERWMKKLGMKELRVFASGENLFTWDNYSGLDPETVNITSGNDAGRNYPLARKWTLGLTLKF